MYSPSTWQDDDQHAFPARVSTGGFPPIKARVCARNHPRPSESRNSYPCKNVETIMFRKKPEIPFFSPELTFL
jgi:hypothetical protein